MLAGKKTVWAVMLPHPAILIIFVAVISGLMAGVTYFYLPKAVVTVTPSMINKTVNQQILISTSVHDPDFVNYKLPAKVIEKEAADKVVVERSTDYVFDDYARGKITLYNEQDQEQQLLPKTHLRHADTGTFFLTDTGVAIPPGGEIGVTVTAKDKGPAGNVKPSRWAVDKLPASLQNVVYGESKLAFSGGVAVDQPLTNEEIEEAKQKLENDLKARARGLLTVAAGGAALRDDLINFVSTMETSVPVGSTASTFEVQGKVVGQAFLLDENDLLGLTLLKVRSTVEAEQEFIEYYPQSFKVDMQRRDLERGEAVVEGSLTGLFSAKLGATVFNVENIAGLTAEEVRDKLKQLPGVGEVEVQLSPFWASVIPARQGAVEMVVNNKAKQN
jgi:hypothetical protein